MRSLSRTIFLGIAILGAACLASPGLLRGQAPPGPLPPTQSQEAAPPAVKPQAQKPPVQPRTSILGAWKLNPDESDDARKKMQDARGGGNNNGGYGGNRRMRGGFRVAVTLAAEATADEGAVRKARATKTASACRNCSPHHAR
jgi:hypothetical protein